MSDASLRELERRWRDGGDESDAEAYLTALVRSGCLPTRMLLEELHRIRRLRIDLQVLVRVFLSPSGMMRLLRNQPDAGSHETTIATLEERLDQAMSAFGRPPKASGILRMLHGEDERSTLDVMGDEEFSSWVSSHVWRAIFDGSFSEELVRAMASRIGEPQPPYAPYVPPYVPAGQVFTQFTGDSVGQDLDEDVPDCA